MLQRRQETEKAGSTCGCRCYCRKCTQVNGSRNGYKGEAEIGGEKLKVCFSSSFSSPFDSDIHTSIHRAQQAAPGGCSMQAHRPSLHSNPGTMKRLLATGRRLLAAQCTKAAACSAASPQPLNGNGRTQAWRTSQLASPRSDHQHRRLFSAAAAAQPTAADADTAQEEQPSTSYGAQQIQVRQ